MIAEGGLRPEGNRNRVVLYQGNSVYGSVNTMVAELAGALRRFGFEPVIIDLRRADALTETLEVIAGGRVVFFLSLNGFGIPEQGAGYYAAVDLPLAMVCVDHPIGLYPLIRCPLARMLTTFPTPHHVDFCRTFVRDDTLCRHLPHAAAAVTTRRRPWRHRDIPLFLSGSVHQDPEEARAGWSHFGPAVCRELNDMVDAHAREPARPLHEVVLAVLERPGLPIHQMYSYLTVLDGYLRDRWRVAFVEHCRDLPLVVCGSGWRGPEGPRDCRRFLGRRPVEDVFGLMARAQIVVNPLPPYYESHERPFQAMARGAVAASGPMPWLGGTQTADSLLWLSADSAAAASLLGTALADAADLEVRAACGLAAFAAAHTWDHRVATLLAWLGTL